MDMNLSELWETVKDMEAWHAAVHWVTVGHNLVTEQQQQEKNSFIALPSKGVSEGKCP